MLKTCPDPVDVLDLQFKLRCRLKVFDCNTSETFKQPHNLVSCASRYGLLFVGTNHNSFQVIQTKNLEEYGLEDKEVVDYPRRSIILPSIPKHLSVNCDSTILAVTVEVNNIPSVLFYDVLSFVRQNVVLIKDVKLAQSAVKVLDVNWNPSIPQTFTVCKSDGSLALYEVNGQNVTFNELPSAAGASCFCWSPKGKQIAVGSKDGKITQYKPDLKAVKVIEAPPLQAPHSLQSLQWVSNFQFIGIYCITDGEPQASMIVVDAPKAGGITYTNYDDICYSSGTNRDVQFYMNIQFPWNLLMIASSNSMELGVLSNQGEDWIQWLLSDNARAELPLNSKHQETLPIGMDLDISSTKPLVWGEDTIPPCPTLILVSNEGLMFMFNIVNLKPGIPTICAPPDPVQDTSGLSLFVKPTSSIPKSIEKTPKPAEAQKIPTTVSLPTLFQPEQTSLFQLKTPQSANNENVSSVQTLFGITQPSTQKPNAQTQPINLFGGQLSLTPIKSQESTPLFGKSTTPTSTPTTNATKYASIFSAIQTPVTSVPANMSSSGNQPSSTTLPLTITFSEKQSQSKITEKVDLKANTETEALLADMIKNECNKLEAEVKRILYLGKIKIDLGTDSEKNEMVNSTEDLQEFVDELTEIGSSQNAEIHYLKQNLIQSWAWFEEARSRYNVSKDETMNILLRKQPLDSASEQVLKDIVHHMCYLDSQLSQASKALDEQWETFQDYARKNHKTQMPTMETIFQSMVRQNAILQKQSYIMKDIAARMKVKHRMTIPSSLLLSIENLDLDDDIKKNNMDSQDISQLQYEKIVARNKQLSVNKSKRLRKFLQIRDVSHITVSKPQLSSSLLHQTPIGRSKQLISILGAQMSPVPKHVTPAARNIPFVQSTPKKDPASTELIGAMPVSPTLSNTTSFTNTSKLSFYPVSKSHSQIDVGSAVQPGLSAFVPTTQSSTFVAVKPKTQIEYQAAVITTWGGDLSNRNVSSYSITTKTTTLPSFSFSGAKLSSNFASTTQGNLLPTVNQIKTIQSPNFTSSVPNLGLGISSSSFSTPGLTNITTTKTSAFSVVSSSDNLILKTTTVPSFISAITPQKQSSVSFGTSTNVLSDSKTTPTTKPLFSFVPPNITVPVVSTVSVNVISSQPAIPTVPKVEVTVSPSTKSLFITPASTFAFATSTTPKTTTTLSSPSIISAIPSNLKQTESLLPKTKEEVTKTITTVTTNTGSVFGSVASNVSTSLFATTTTTPSIFSGNLQFGKTNTTESITPIIITTTASQSETSKNIPDTPITYTQPIFGTTAPSLNITSTQSTNQTVIFGKTTTTTTEDTPIVSSSSIFTSTTPSTPVTPVFGQPTQKSDPSVVTSNTTTSGGFFSNPPQSVFSSKPATTASSIFSGTSGNSLFGTTSTTSQIFGQTTATNSNIFGSTTSTSQPSTNTNIFSGASQPSTSTNVFASKPTSIFGSSTATATTAAPLFGSVSTPTSSSLFGVATTSTTQSVFGGTVTSPGFGTSTSAPFGQQPVFGTPSTTAGGFGPTTFGNANVFGTNSSTSTTFGQTSFGTTQSIFGGNSTTSSNIFGGTPTTSSTFGSSSVFGTPTSNNASVFGGSSNAFSSPATQSSSFSFANAGSNVQNAGNSLSFGALNMGNANATTTASNVFGSPSTFVAQPTNPFSRSEPIAGTGNIFGTPASTSSSIFGGSTSGSIFGGGGSSGFGSPAFGSTSYSQGTPGFASPQAGPFSGGSGNTFGGSPATGPFSGSGSPSVAQGGFGSPPAFQKSAFGSSATFGSPPAFGSSPSFGGAPAFGAQSFGSPNKVFGSSPPGTTSFGATQAQNSTFANLSTQSTVGFGNLAQQSGSNTNSNAFSGGSSFTSWR